MGMDQIFRYKVFARALLDGEVIEGFPGKCQGQLLARPPLVLQAPNNPRVLGIVSPLWQNRVGSRAELLRKWQNDHRFLLEGYLKWLPTALHDDTHACAKESRLLAAELPDGLELRFCGKL